MRVFKIFLIVSIIGFIFSCSKEEVIYSDTNLEVIEEKGSNLTRDKRPQNINRPVYSKRKLIIKYKKGVPEYRKHKLRKRFGIKKGRTSRNGENSNCDPEELSCPGGVYRVCDLCPDGMMELWTFNEDIDIEHKSGSIEPEGDSEGSIVSDVDYEFIVNLETDENPGFDVNTCDSDYSDKILNNSNQNVTIAVLDSGVAPCFFEEPFLYDSSTTAIDTELSGWDFVNSDNNPFDDNPTLHGTIVTSIASNYLESSDVQYQILPVKVCDEDGKVSYFDLVCGTKWALNYADVLQMSLGWYEHANEVLNDTSILYNLIEDHRQEVLVVTSAGNSNRNTDSGLLHYPSGYPSHNILSIASVNQNRSHISSFSNYGLETVDFYALGEEVPFTPFSGGSTYYVSGTSFSAPHVSAKASEIYFHNMGINPVQVINYLDLDGTDVSNYFNDSKPIKYSKIID